MLVLQLALDVILIMFVLAFLPLFLGDLLLFADPGSSLVFLCTTLTLFVVLWTIDRLSDDSLWTSSEGSPHAAPLLLSGIGQR